MPTPGPAPDGRDRDWRIYRGDGTRHDGIAELPPPPPWRRFAADEAGDLARARRLGDQERAASYRGDGQAIDKVNAAMLLRRPLLVTGKPGSGKSTLAYSLAYELGLGPVLSWSVSSRTTLEQGLYDYDAIGRVHETSLRRSGAGAGGGSGDDGGVPDIGRYIRLGPLGTALLPGERPRVVLIDELDKSDIDLPNDLLNVLEEGRFTIPELERLPEGQETVEVMTDDGRAAVRRGQVRCTQFPIVVITSNGEREFPPAFLRRCVRAAIEPPSRDRLADIVEAHLGPDARAAGDQLIRDFLARREHGDLATDQLLNSIFLSISGSRPPEADLAALVEAIMRPLGGGPE